MLGPVRVVVIIRVDADVVGARMAHQLGRRPQVLDSLGHVSALGDAQVEQDRGPEVWQTGLGNEPLKLLRTLSLLAQRLADGAPSRSRSQRTRR